MFRKLYHFVFSSHTAIFTNIAKLDYYELLSFVV